MNFEKTKWTMVPVTLAEILELKKNKEVQVKMLKFTSNLFVIKCTAAANFASNIYKTFA